MMAAMMDVPWAVSSGESMAQTWVGSMAGYLGHSMVASSADRSVEMSADRSEERWAGKLVARMVGCLDAPKAAMTVGTRVAMMAASMDTK